MPPVLEADQYASRVTHHRDHKQCSQDRDVIRRQRPPCGTNRDEFGNDVQLHQNLR
jgi:hypothetical protein